MNEEVIQFGDEKRLIGIACKPSAQPKRIAVIILNSGLLSKAGSFRFSVELARSLAETGILSFRFDFGGIGDSETGLSSETFIERHSQEIDLAMNALQVNYGINKFMIGGLCSAADCALSLKPKDERLKGLILIDPPAYRTKSFYLHHKIKRIFRTLRSLDLDRWLTIFKKFKFSNSSTSTSELNFRVFPPQKEMENTINKHLSRGNKIFVTYTGGALSHFNHKNQFYKMFPNLKSLQNLSLHYLPKSDHLGILEEDREILNQLIVSWCETFEY